MSAPKQPGVDVGLTIPRFAGTDTPVYSTRARGGATFVAERVAAGGWEPIRRFMSDDSGNLRMSSGGCVLSDETGEIGDALLENEPRFIAETEAKLTVLSEAGRIAALAARSLLRGRVRDAAPMFGVSDFRRQKSIRLSFTDAIAKVLDQNVLSARFLRADYPDIHRDLENTFIPVVVGEHSDAGAEDVSGNSAEKGLVPAIYVGGRRNVEDDPTTGTPSYLLAPSVSYSINGTPGTRTLYYTFTTLNNVGESLPAVTIVVDDAPAVLDGTNNIEFTITAVTGATGYVAYGRRNPTPVRRLVVLDAATLTYTDTGADEEYAPGPPAINTAQVTSVTDDFFWDFYVYALGYVPLVKLFGSDVAHGTEPKRVDITATEGVDYIEFHGIIGGNEVSGFYARGPRSFHHTQGIVTFAVQTCGIEDVGDGSGDPFNQAFPILQHVLNEYVFKRYTSGLYGPLMEFVDGAPILQTSKFAACQTLTQEWLGDAIGYQGAVYLREPMTVREFLRLWCLTFDCFIGVNHHGQIYPILYDSQASVQTGRLYRERIEIARIESPVLDKEHVEPEQLFQFDWDPDAQRFRSEVRRVVDQDAFDEQAGTLRATEVRGLRFTRDEATAEDSRERRRDRLKYPRWKQTIVARYTPALEDEPGDQIRIDHTGGPGTWGWVERPFVVEEHAVDPNVGEVTLVCYDVQPLLILGVS